MQVLAVERELERVRSDLDRIKGRLAFLRDRVARATVAIALHSPEAPSDQLPFARKPQISSGVRALSFVDVRESGTSGYLGSGLTLRLPSSGGETARGLILDVDVMRACCKSRPDRSSWAYDILLGFDLYSDALQSGRRRWLNPYLGARVGYSQTQDRGDFAAAGVFGLEIFKTSALMIDVQARAMALVGNPDGPHAASTLARIRPRLLKFCQGRPAARVSASNGSMPRATPRKLSVTPVCKESAVASSPERMTSRPAPRAGSESEESGNFPGARLSGR